MTPSKCLVLFWLLLTASAFSIPVRFVAFDLPVKVGACQIVAENGEGETTTVEIGVSRFSPAIDLRPGQYILTLPDGNTTGKLVLAGEDKAKRIAIVLPGTKGKVNVISAPDDAANFGPGDRFFINATPDEIRMQLAERNLSLKPGTTRMVGRPGKHLEGRLPVRMAVRRDGDWIVFNSTYWPDDPTCRSFILLHPNPATGVPAVKTIEELPPAE